MSEDSIPVTVQILDKDYRIACAVGEEAALMDCARMLDGRMREVRQNGRVIGADRIAVMAALNVIYDLMREQNRIEVSDDRLAQLQSRVAEAVEAGATGGGAAAGSDT